MTSKWTRSRDDTLAALQAQLKLITVLCASYDTGFKEASASIANHVATIVHDRGRGTRSILTQLGIRDRLNFLSSRLVPPGMDEAKLKGRWTPLVGIAMGAVVEYVPHLGTVIHLPFAKNLVSFDEWWDKERVIIEDSDLFLTRHSLVTSYRDQDGGTHLDPELSDPAYVRISRDTKSPQVFRDQDGNNPLMGIEQSTMRQIAWELQQTLTDKAIAAALS